MRPENVTGSNRTVDADARPPRKKSFLSVFGKVVRKLVRSTPFLTALFATLLVFVLTSPFFGSHQVFRVISQDLTTTVTAATESLSFSLIENAQSSWVLPPGKFLILDEPERLGECGEAPREYEFISQGFFCTTDIRTRLVVEGAATITHTVDPTGDWTVTVTGSSDVDFTAYILDVDDEELARTKRDISFELSLGDDGLDEDLKYLSFPIVAATGQIGSDVRYASTIEGNIDDFWEPTLLAGSVTTFALNFPEQGKYQILSERLDSGDIIGIFTEDTIFGRKSDDTIWGVASIREQTVSLSDTTEVEQFVIFAVLHTTHRALTVGRFGSAEGHKIRASNWSIISKWPNGQETWVLFISLILILTFVLELSGAFKSKPLKSGKKGKKHRKRKRKGD